MKWLNDGAKPTDTVKSLFDKIGISKTSDKPETNETDAEVTE